MRDINDIIERESRMIKNSVLYFILGNVFFLTICATATWYGCLCIHRLFTQWELSILEKSGILLGIGGFALFVLIIANLLRKENIPEGYREITRFSHPTFFRMINGIQSELKITKTTRIFLSNTAEASIFVLPDIQNIMRQPERHLSIGEPLIQNLTEEELKAVLLHEFAHIVQEEITNTTRAASIGLFAKSFLNEGIDYKSSRGPGNLTLALMAFYYLFLYLLCRHIKGHYEKLTDELEYGADSIATRYIAPKTLANALLHIIRLKNEPEIPTSVRLRIERLGALLPKEREKATTKTTKAKIILQLSNKKHFIPWVDYTYPILLNGEDFGYGNFIKGFTIEKDVAPDAYSIEVASHISTLTSKPHIFEAEAGHTYHIHLDYKYDFMKTKYIIFCQKMTIHKHNKG